MISNQILQNTLDGLKAISRVDFAVIDTDGKTIVSTTENELEYPGQIKVNVIRETRAVEFAK